MVMTRDRGYDDLLSELRGRRVLVWTCGTCARLCDGLGGRESAERLSERLSRDGVDVVGTVSVGASCVVQKVSDNLPSDGGFDVVLALTCDIGAGCVGDCCRAEVVNPVLTFGSGYLAADGTPRLRSVVCGRTVSDESLPEVSSRHGVPTGPYV